MPTRKLRSVKGRRVRFTALDECGAPDLSNPCGSIVTSGFISITWADEIETGEEYTQKNAWGDFCIGEKDADRVKWTNVTISLCEIDPEILVMLGGAEPNYDADGNIVGAFFTRNPNPLCFAIEVWTKKAGTDACAGGGAPEWGYFAGFNVRNGMLDGDLTIENAPLALNLKGELYGASAAWGVGPYLDNPLENVSGAPEGALRYIGITTVQPPDETDGCVAIIPATSVTAGNPGTWTPTGAAPPANLADLMAATSLAVLPTTAATIANVALTSNVVTITTAAPHTYAVGDQVDVAAVTKTEVNGTYTVASAPTGTTFTYAKTGANITAAADTGTVTGRKKWTTGQHVVLGDGSHAYWDGDEWKAGNAP